MKQVTLNVYTAEELKEQFPEGFDRAYRHFKEKQSFYYGWTNEVTKTMETFLKLFDCHFLSWDAFGYPNARFEYTHGEVELEVEDEFEIYGLDDLKGNLLDLYFNQYFSKDELKIFHNYGSCPLTGICFDHEPLRIIHEYLIGNRPNHSLMDLIDEGLELLMDEVQSDMLYHESVEFFLETYRDSGDYFTESGQLFV